MNIVSMCLYGDDPMYVHGVEENARLRPVIYPGWELWCYTDRRDFACPGVRVIQCAPHNGHNLMFARFLAAADPAVERVVFRDADSRIGSREKAAVDDWIASCRSFHVMRDHPDHAEWPVLGGMWGVAGDALRDIGSLVAAWPSHTQKLDDMRFLSISLWPRISRDMLHHSSVPTRHPEAVPFPPVDGDHVGKIIRPA
jgi:hypothetical protein